LKATESSWMCKSEYSDSVTEQTGSLYRSEWGRRISHRLFHCW